MKLIKFLLGLMLFCSLALGQIPTNGLLAYYPFNGNANDESGNGRNGAVFNAVLQNDRFGIEGSSYYFDGSSHIELPKTFEELNLSFTVSFWIKPEYILHKDQHLFSFLGNKFIMASYSSTNGLKIHIADNYNSGKIEYYNLQTDQWSLVTLIKSGTELRIYVNNSLEKTSITQVAFPRNYSIKNVIGNSHNLYPDRGFNGQLDDIRIYNRVLETNEISKIYYEVKQPKPKVTNFELIFPQFDESPRNITLNYTIDQNCNVVIKNQNQEEILNSFLTVGSYVKEINNLEKGEHKYTISLENENGSSQDSTEVYNLNPPPVQIDSFSYFPESGNRKPVDLIVNYTINQFGNINLTSNLDGIVLEKSGIPGGSYKDTIKIEATGIHNYNFEFTNSFLEKANNSIDNYIVRDAAPKISLINLSPQTNTIEPVNLKIDVNIDQSGDIKLLDSLNFVIKELLNQPKGDASFRLDSLKAGFYNFKVVLSNTNGSDTCHIENYIVKEAPPKITEISTFPEGGYVGGAVTLKYSLSKTCDVKIYHAENELYSSNNQAPGQYEFLLENLWAGGNNIVVEIINQNGIDSRTINHYLKSAPVISFLSVNPESGKIGAQELSISYQVTGILEAFEFSLYNRDTLVADLGSSASMSQLVEVPIGLVQPGNYMFKIKAKAPNGQEFFSTNKNYEILDPTSPPNIGIRSITPYPATTSPQNVSIEYLAHRDGYVVIKDSLSGEKYFEGFKTAGTHTFTKTLYADAYLIHCRITNPYGSKYAARSYHIPGERRPKIDEVNYTTSQNGDGTYDVNIKYMNSRHSIMQFYKNGEMVKHIGSMEPGMYFQTFENVTAGEHEYILYISDTYGNQSKSIEVTTDIRNQPVVKIDSLKPATGTTAAPAYVTVYYTVNQTSEVILYEKQDILYNPGPSHNLFYDSYPQGQKEPGNYSFRFPFTCLAGYTSIKITSRNENGYDFDYYKYYLGEAPDISNVSIDRPSNQPAPQHPSISFSINKPATVTITDINTDSVYYKQTFSSSIHCNASVGGLLAGDYIFRVKSSDSYGEDFEDIPFSVSGIQIPRIDNLKILPENGCLLGEQYKMEFSLNNKSDVKVFVDGFLLKEIKDMHAGLQEIVMADSVIGIKQIRIEAVNSSGTAEKEIKDYTIYDKLRLDNISSKFIIQESQKHIEVKFVSNTKADITIKLNDDIVKTYNDLIPGEYSYVIENVQTDSNIVKIDAINNFDNQDLFSYNEELKFGEINIINLEPRQASLEEQTDYLQLEYYVKETGIVKTYFNDIEIRRDTCNQTGLYSRKIINYNSGTHKIKLVLEKSDGAIVETEKFETINWFSPRVVLKEIKQYTDTPTSIEISYTISQNGNVKIYKNDQLEYQIHQSSNQYISSMHNVTEDNSVIKIVIENSNGRDSVSGTYSPSGFLEVDTVKIVESSKEDPGDYLEVNISVNQSGRLKIFRSEEPIVIYEELIETPEKNKLIKLKNDYQNGLQSYAFVLEDNEGVELERIEKGYELLWPKPKVEIVDLERLGENRYELRYWISQNGRVEIKKDGLFHYSLDQNADEYSTTLNEVEIGNTIIDISISNVNGLTEISKNVPHSYLVKIGSDGNGKVRKNGEESGFVAVIPGEDLSLEFVSNSGYEVWYIDINGVETELDSTVYTLKNVNENKNIRVFFRKNNWEEGIQKKTYAAGKVLIGTESIHPDYSLLVDSKIKMKEVRVETGWSDYVFEDDYDLLSLSELAEYIQRKGHLPEIPDTKKVLSNGICGGNISSKLLAKIEELTLYIIQNQKRIKRIGEKTNMLK